MADNATDLAIHTLAMEIARQKSPGSVLTISTSPLEIARALYLLGWQPPAATPLEEDE